jgi:high-affinity iron transporter
MAILGAVVAAVASLTAGLALYAFGVRLEGPAEELFEGVAMLFAAGVLTWMLFWMNRQGSSLRDQLEHRVGEAVEAGGTWAIFSLAFISVFREGIELALFLTAAAFTATAAATVGGGLVGLAAAFLVGWLLFASTTRLNVRALFRVSGLLLLVFAAGLFAHGIHEFNELGLIPSVIEHVWDINPILDENSTAGQILKALVGYNGNPSLTEVVGYVAYWVTILLALRQSSRRQERVMARA